jgi:hypothetical protein
MIAATHGKTPHLAFRPSADTVKAHKGKGSIERDTSGDGVFDVHEARTDLDASFKIHMGYRTMTGSAGCQVVHIDDYEEFLKATRRGGKTPQSLWWYTLVNVG